MTASALSLKVFLPNDLTMSTAMPQKIKIFTIGKSNHNAYKGFRPMILHQVAKFFPGIYASIPEYPAFSNKGLRLRLNKI